MYARRRQHGLTLIELIVVIVILGILASEKGCKLSDLVFQMMSFIKDQQRKTQVHVLDTLFPRFLKFVMNAFSYLFKALIE